MAKGEPDFQMALLSMAFVSVLTAGLGVREVVAGVNDGIDNPLLCAVVMDCQAFPSMVTALPLKLIPLLKT